MTTETLARAVRDGIARTTAVVGLAGVALIHLLDLPGKFGETPYLAWLYIGLILGCVVAAAALIRHSDPRAWTAAALLPLGALVGFTLTRTVGLPQAMGDIGQRALRSPRSRRDRARGAEAPVPTTCGERRSAVRLGSLAKPELAGELLSALRGSGLAQGRRFHFRPHCLA